MYLDMYTHPCKAFWVTCWICYLSTLSFQNVSNMIICLLFCMLLIGNVTELHLGTGACFVYCSVFVFINSLLG